MWCVRTFQWKGNWINWLEYNFEFKILILNFEFNLSITVSLRKVIKECFTSLNYYQIWIFKLKCIKNLKIYKN